MFQEVKIREEMREGVTVREVYFIVHFFKKE